MEQRRNERKSGLLTKLMFVIAMPALLGVLGGYGLHRYLASRIREDFSPYRIAQDTSKKNDFNSGTFGFVATPTEQNFGEIDNYKRYRNEWEIRSTGRMPLEVELVSKTCDVEFDGAPIGEKRTIKGQGFAKLALTWIVDNNESKFSHEVVIKTNDDFEERQTWRFRVYGTVNTAIEVQPALLDFGDLTSGQTKELTARVLCYRTKNFKIEDFTFSNEATRSGFDVKLSPIENPKSLGGDRVPIAALEIVVTAKADSLEKKSYHESLLLKCNLPQTEGLKIGLKVNSQ